MKLTILVVILSLFAGIATAAPRLLQFGAGAHYMNTVGDIKDAAGFDSDALNLVLGAKRSAALLNVELDSEWSFNFGGSDKTLWMPQLFGLMGRMIYGGAGIGTGYFDGEWFNDPIYSLRAGVILPLRQFSVDVNATYQFMSFDQLEAANTDDLDSVTFGAILWF